ncbi:methyltransferase domain-containing protein [Salarchaeum sp. JOR-1]|uniref:methyltransferase domain-containing protein n=1 Tax=Salarchaeum sp. JOR-1 TaxID=2599399 RepID=UPI00119841C6|nr:methyltransferase domain-containing protein [Salarchaeum sp. JOR-1]QDX40371.1 methyltransferase domain-containing protein [Salarchaeum sp. JOR-1]
MGVLEDKGRARVFYKYLSKVYDEVNAFIWTEGMRDETLEWFDLDAGDSVLDVGCGTGFGTEGLLRYTDDVTGLDQSEHQLEKATAKLGTEAVDFTRGDAERLPFATNSFDAVWSSGSIEYWPNPHLALREFRRVVRPGGKVLVVGPDYPDSTVMQKVADAIMLFYDESEADRMFRDAGFVDTEHRVLQAEPNRPRAIVSFGRVPDDG